MLVVVVSGGANGFLKASTASRLYAGATEGSVVVVAIVVGRCLSAHVRMSLWLLFTNEVRCSAHFRVRKSAVTIISVVGCHDTRCWKPSKTRKSELTDEVASTEYGVNVG